MSDEQVPPAPPDAPPPPPPEAPPPPPAAPPPPPPTAAAAGTGTVSENRTIMIILAYLGPLALIPFLAEKDDTEVQWHSKHGLVLFAAEIVLWVVVGISFSAVTAIFPLLGCITIPLGLLLGLALLAFHILCMVKGNQGERLKVPVVSDFADKF